MNVSGILINTADGSTSTFEAFFTGQYPSTTIGAVAAAAESSAGILSNSWSATISATAAVGCPATPGYWKQETKHPFPSSLSFPVTIGGIAYSASDFYTVLGNPGGGNAVQILGYQLVAAILNIAAGGEVNSTTLAAIAQANTDLTGINLTTGSVAPSSALGQDMLVQAGILGSYNSGFNNTCQDGTGLTIG